MATTDRPEVTGGADEWKRRYEATPEREGELFSTISGVENDPLYSPENVELDYERDLGWPGAYPFTRGVYPSMYRGRLWTMRQFAGFGTAEETNARFRYLLDHGQTGLSTAFDMPTLMGYDSDHPRGGLECRAGARLHARRRLRVRRGVPRARPRRRRVRATVLLLLQRPSRLLRGDREVPGGAADLGAADAREVRRARPALVADALPHPDGRRFLDRAAAGGEPDPHGDRGARRRARRDAVAPHELVRRGARAADRARGAARAAHAAGDRARDRCREHDRSARGLLLSRT